MTGHFIDTCSEDQVGHTVFALGTWTSSSIVPGTSTAHSESPHNTPNKIVFPPCFSISTIIVQVMKTSVI